MKKKSAGLKKDHPKRRARPGRASSEAAAQMIRAIFRHAAIAFLTYDREGKLLLWNKALEGLLEWPAERLSGKSLFEIAAGDEWQRTGGFIKAVFSGKGVAGIPWEIKTGGETRYLS